MGEPLANPPLVEAVCVLNVAPEVVSGELPERLASALGVGFEAPTSVEHYEPNDDEHRYERVVRHRYLSKDSTAIVQLTPGALVVNHLKPNYVSWTHYREKLRAIVDALVAAVGVIRVSQAGLRYINALVPPEPKNPRIADVISLGPIQKGPLAKPLLGFYQRYELLHREEEGVLTLQVGTGAVADDPEHKASQPALILDIDFSSRREFTTDDVDGLMAWLDTAHERIGDVFRASLTPSFYEHLRLGPASTAVGET